MITFLIEEATSLLRVSLIAICLAASTSSWPMSLIKYNVWVGEPSIHKVPVGSLTAS